MTEQQEVYSDVILPTANELKAETGSSATGELTPVQVCQPVAKHAKRQRVMTSPFCDACFSVFPAYSKPTADWNERTDSRLSHGREDGGRALLSAGGRVPPEPERPAAAVTNCGGYLERRPRQQRSY